MFAVCFVVLGYLGLQPAEGLYVILARIFAVVYFAYFILMPWYSRIDKVKPVPERVVSMNALAGCSPSRAFLRAASRPPRQRPAAPRPRPAPVRARTGRAGTPPMTSPISHPCSAARATSWAIAWAAIRSSTSATRGSASTWASDAGGAAAVPDRTRGQAGRLHSDHHACRPMRRPGSARRRLICRSWRGRAAPDYLYQFLKTFYVDPSKPTGANNLRLPVTAMPAVLSELEGLKRAVFKDEQETARRRQEHDGARVRSLRADRAGTHERRRSTTRSCTIRSTFSTMSGEPTQVERRALGIWVVLFLLVFTCLAWLLKQQYWKDVH